MIKALNQWISERPYLVASLIFILIFLFGWLFLYWNKEDFAFVLLLYFIVTLGIRLDDISHKIGTPKRKENLRARENESLIGQLNAIQSTLQQINVMLDSLAASAARNKADGPGQNDEM